MPFDYLSDNLIRLVAPINTQPDPNTVVSAGTCTARIFDSDRETVLTADEASGQTVLSVSRPSSITVGSDVVVQLADGTYHDAGAVTARDLAAKTVTVTTALAAAGAVSGARVMTQLGATLTLAAYGTPSLTTTDWGFEGIFPSTQADVQPGQNVRIEIKLDASGVDLVQAIRTVVEVGT